MYITPNNGSPHLCLKYTVVAAYGRNTVVRVELRVMIKYVARHRRRTDKTIRLYPDACSNYGQRVLYLMDS
jgi:hypothetical protein